MKIVKEVTRQISTAKETLNDHIWVTNLYKLVQYKNISTNSDHNLLIAILKSKGEIHCREHTNTRYYAKI